MNVCRWIDVLYGAVPVARWRAFLIARHMDRCPHCQSRLAGRDEARRLLVDPGTLAPPPGHCDRLLAAEAAAPPLAQSGRPRLRLAWSWAAAAAAVILLFAAGLWLARTGPAPSTAPETEDRFALHYVRAGGAPARTYVFQSPDTDAVFVWAERDL